MDPEMEELPTDLQRGLDFQIVKTSKGGYADYSTSKWSRKESALNSDEQAAIDEHGLFNLSDFLPKQPTEADLKVIKEMFEASVDGQPYDVERWGAYYKPYGVDAPNAAPKAESADAPAPAATVDPDEDEVPAPTAPVTAEPVKQNAQDILAMIRNRQKQ
jgi:homogentisate 1,2-dioxygenase